ncbi:MAG: hypothetical protein MUP27_09190 [Desulfobacterales bacterium]|nr:hypothetical protein [Desulfobacterales bacterium]
MEYIPGPCDLVIEAWERWCGKTKWTELLSKFNQLGGQIIWWCGFPQSKSAIPLCFSLYLNGEKLECHSRLKDIQHAINKAEMRIKC